MNSPGLTSLGGSIGNTTPLTSLTTDAPGSTSLAGGSINTSGAQLFNDAVTLAANTNLNGSSISWSQISGNNYNLSLTGSVSIQAANLTGIANLTTGATGTTAITGELTTAGSQLYGNPLIVAAGTQLVAGGQISIDSSLSSSGDLQITTLGGSLHLGTSTVGGNLTAITNNGAISQSGPLIVNGITSLSSGTGNITLLNTGNRFAVIPLTILSSGTVQIYPCIATTSCVESLATGNGQARQVILNTNPGLTQSNQVSSLTALSDPSTNSDSTPTQRQPDSNGSGNAAGRQRINFGQSSLDFDSSSSTCASAGGCDLQSSTFDINRFSIDSGKTSSRFSPFRWSQLRLWRDALS